jgi:hypothetical protein
MMFFSFDWWTSKLDVGLLWVLPFLAVFKQSVANQP